MIIVPTDEESYIVSGTLAFIEFDVSDKTDMALEHLLSRMGLETKQLNESHYTGSHKGNAAMSALTLLAFLFFLHILQQCLKEHMMAMSTPQVMIMTAGKEGDESVAKLSRNNKIDKTGVPRADEANDVKTFPDEETVAESHTSTGPSPPENFLKIKIAEHRPRDGAHKYKIIKNHVFNDEK
ncbi:unnamed protein product, partial [Iphiclides podalirius]